MDLSKSIRNGKNIVNSVNSTVSEISRTYDVHIDILSIEHVDNSKYKILFSTPFIYNDVCEFKVNRAYIYEKFRGLLVEFKPVSKKSDIAIKLGVKKHWISENKIQIPVNIDSKPVIVTTYYYTISNNIDIVKKFREHKLNKLING